MPEQLGQDEQPAPYAQLAHVLGQNAPGSVLDPEQVIARLPEALQGKFRPPAEELNQTEIRYLGAKVRRLAWDARRLT